MVMTPLREGVFRKSACVQNVCAKILRKPSKALILKPLLKVAEAQGYSDIRTIITYIHVNMAIIP